MLTASEAATEMGRSVVTVRKLCQTGKLRAMKLGPMWLISRSDLDEFRSLERKRGWFAKSKGLTTASVAV